MEWKILELVVEHIPSTLCKCYRCETLEAGAVRMSVLTITNTLEVGNVSSALPQYSGPVVKWHTSGRQGKKPRTRICRKSGWNSCPLRDGQWISYCPKATTHDDQHSSACFLFPNHCPYYASILHHGFERANASISTEKKRCTTSNIMFLLQNGILQRCLIAVSCINLRLFLHSVKNTVNYCDCSFVQSKTR